MAKKNEIRLLIGVALIVIGLVGIGRILSVLLVLFGGYLVYEAVKK